MCHWFSYAEFSHPQNRRRKKKKNQKKESGEKAEEGGAVHKILVSIE